MAAMNVGTAWIEGGLAGWARAGVLALALCCGANAGAQEAWDTAGGTTALLDAVNRRINAYERVSDDDAWGRKEHWSTPAELRAVGGGDCEDLAIAKYFLLRRLGVPAAKLRLAVGKVLNPARGRLESHMVLVVRTEDAVWRVLDSLTDEVAGLDRRPDLSISMAFNEQGAWRVTPEGEPLAALPFPRRWQSLMQRAGRAQHAASG